MTIVFHRAGEPTPDDRRIEAQAVVSLTAIASGAAQACIDRIVAVATGLAPDVRLSIDATYTPTEQRMDFTLSGGASGLRLLDALAEDGAAVFDREAYSRMVLRVEPVRYELRIALGDHLASAAKNHPPGPTPLRLETQYDEEAERLLIEVTGTVLATSYLLFLTWLQVTQSRYR